jgi:hypothetical protein
MKHLLNNMSEEEKNAIREQHGGGMKVMTENFYKLLNSKLGDSKPLISEQTNKYPSEDPIQKPFYDYVQTRWGHDEDPYASTDIDFDQNGNYKLCDGPCKAMIPGTDENTIIWDYKKGMVSGLKSFGIDPKPISIKSNFGQMKQWFDNTYGKSSQKTTTSGGHPDGL